MKFEGLLIRAGERTKNGRVFSKAAIEAVLASGGSKVVKGTLVGTFSLPGETSPEEIDISDIAVLVTNLFSEDEGSELHAEVETLETFGGRYASHANECIEEARKEGRVHAIGKLVLRPRGTGTVLEDGTIGDDYVLEGVSLCLELESSIQDFEVKPELLKGSEAPDNSDLRGIRDTLEELKAKWIDPECVDDPEELPLELAEKLPPIIKSLNDLLGREPNTYEMFEGQVGKRTVHQWGVDQFMVKAKQDLPLKPTLPDEKVRLLRARLILEETLEVIKGLGFRPRINSLLLRVEDTIFDKGFHEPDLPEIADGCADLSVVTIGTLSACGIADAPLLAEVDRNNLAKFGPGHTYREDGKLVKPPDHQPPDIKRVLKEQGSKPCDSCKHHTAGFPYAFKGVCFTCVGKVAFGEKVVTVGKPYSQYEAREVTGAVR